MTLEFPLYKRELLGLLRTRHAFWLLVRLVGLAYLSLMVSDTKDLIAIVGSIAMGLCFLVVPACSAGSIPREIEQGNLDLLRSTLLDPTEVFGESFLARSTVVSVLSRQPAGPFCSLSSLTRTTRWRSSSSASPYFLSP